MSIAKRIHEAPGAAATLISLLALLLLTVATTGIAFLSLGPVAGELVAMAIAVTKAAIVVAVFMHLADESLLMRTIALGAVAWMLVLGAGVIAELLTR
jgi:cytochrome c oxidase subunit 4